MTSLGSRTGRSMRNVVATMLQSGLKLTKRSWLLPKVVASVATQVDLVTMRTDHGFLLLRRPPLKTFPQRGVCITILCQCCVHLWRGF